MSELQSDRGAELVERPAWPAWQRVIFRAAFAYFVLFATTSLLDVGNGPRRILRTLRDPAVGWFGHAVLGARGSPNDSGVRWGIANLVVPLMAAVAIAVVWSLASKRPEYRRLLGWMRLVLRYYVGIVMMIYGAFKVIPSQFPPISLDQLAQPLGALSPMGLLWSFMGYSAVYEMFTGFGEAIGAFLLFFRRTTTAGALLLIAVLSNVALLNFAYDVPVKQLSSNLLMAAIFLAAPDAVRLFDVLFRNRPTRAADLGLALPRWLARVRRFVKPIVVAGATAVPLVFSAGVSPRLREAPPLFGIYDVRAFVRNGVAVLPLATDSARWRSVVFGRAGSMSIRLMTDSVRQMSIVLDSLTRSVTYQPRGAPAGRQVLRYETPGNGSLRVRGIYAGDSVDVTLEKLDHRRAFRLLRGM